MKRIGRRARILIVVALYFAACSGVFLYRYTVGASDWVAYPANRNVFDRSSALIRPSAILSGDGTALFVADKSGSAYAKSLELRRATLHAIGDRGDRINTGVVRNYKASLIGYDLLNGVYNPTENGTTIQLTLNAEVCRAAYNAMGNYNGTVGIMNYKTGEILCMVSKPSFDPDREPDFNAEAYEGVFINRLTGGLYVPGSIFKLITAMAAIETIPDIFEQQFVCKGSVSYGNDVLNCNGTHGTLDFKRALAKSCNCAFASIAAQLGKETLAEYAAKAGLGQSFEVSGVSTIKGRFDLSKAAPVELAWAGIGQYTTLVNPMQYLLFMSAVASGGSYRTPFYVEGIQSASGLPQYFKPGGKKTSMLEESTAQTLAEMMRNNTIVQYGDGNYSGMALCAKSGTAETSDGKPHAWFVGFLDKPETPLAFVVILEHAGSGQSVAGPVARRALQAAVKQMAK